MVAYPIAQALLNAGARIDLQDRDGYTPVAYTRSVNVYQTADDQPRFERDWHLKMYFCWVELLQSLEKLLAQNHWLVFEEDTLIKDCYWNMSFFNMVKSAIDNVMVPTSLRNYLGMAKIYDDCPNLPAKSIASFHYLDYPAICSGTTLVKNSALYYFIYNF